MAPNLVQIGLIVFSGITVAAGQGCLTFYARGLPMPLDLRTVLHYTITTWSFYGFAALYGVGMIAYVLLLKALPLAQVTISIVAINFLCTTLLTHLLGSSLSLQQLAGIVLVFAGVSLLQWQS